MALKMQLRSLNDSAHGNASIAPGYPQNPICHPLHPAANAHAKPA
jgi:hypothetical protein